MKFWPLLLLCWSASALECLPQKYLDKLDTKYYYKHWLKNPNSNKLKQYLNSLHEFRASHYGRISGERVTYPFNKMDVTHFIKKTNFMGLELKVHQKIMKPLKCVEKEILNNCQKDGHAYLPRMISGYRSSKSYKRVISNHRFGIAVDFDPLDDHSRIDGNPCCGLSCKLAWRSHPICKNHDTTHNSPFNVSILNPCWVNSFEKYGFHWLINYRMHDTMHFEYLGDPTAWQ